MVRRATAPGADALRFTASPVAEPLYALRLDDGSLRLALSCQEVADLTSMSLREVWGAIERGGLAPIDPAARYKRITVQALLTYLGLIQDRKAA